MMAGPLYGSRPDLLPDFIGYQDRDTRSSARKLDLDESRELESESLNKFPQLSVGALDWSGVRSVEHFTFHDEADGVELLQHVLESRFAADAELAIFWGSLVVPTVLIQASGLSGKAQDLLDVDLDFWVYDRAHHSLLEVLQDGRLAIAKILDH